MFKRLSVSTLLTSVIALLATATVGILARGAWESSQALAEATRIAAVTRVSGDLFTSLHNLRLDRASSLRDLPADRVFTSLTPQLERSRTAELPALKASVAGLRALDFPGHDTVAEELDRAVKRLVALHGESVTALGRPKAERRAGLLADYSKETAALLEFLDRTSAQLVKSVKLQDAYVDQMLELKQLAWVTRNAAGDTALLVSNPLAGQPLVKDPLITYAAMVSKIDSTWAVLLDLAAGMRLSPDLSAAIETAKREFFAPAFSDLRLTTLKALIAGTPPGISGEDWTPLAVSKLTYLQAVAQKSLDDATRYAEDQQAAATRALWVQLGLLATAAVFGIAMIVVVTRRVIRPLVRLTGVMKVLAGGDVSVTVTDTRRSDEVGAMAQAVLVFQQGMVRNNQLEQETAQARLRAEEARRNGMHALADEFEQAVGGIIRNVSASSGALHETAQTMTAAARKTSTQSTAVAAAAEQASTNVVMVASSAEELGASVDEISRQVEQSADLSSTAVAEAAKTGDVIRELALAAARIGDFIGLISNIANQTNLLALNATIEAARAGDAGKGFAVVASEVKALAAQTGKATEEIESQISSIQSTTDHAVKVIDGVSTQIRKMSDVATGISAAVEQQGVATREIVRNVDQAATGTNSVTSHIADVARTADETGTAAAHVLTASAALSEQAQQLETQMQRFLTTVRAA
ncbi:methyl-accepting chemotaxis protein [Azorhizobium sp. AG788]|uniref:methyl-accepting chemotaxis protein n=1 Tax=Azorhizobium sp. AG788 TaxID=2183897 RepID=UPI003139418E